MSDPKDVSKGAKVEIPTSEQGFQVTERHEKPAEGVPEEVGITSQQADIGFAGGKKGQRQGPMETGSEHLKRADPSA